MEFRSFQIETTDKTVSGYGIKFDSLAFIPEIKNYEYFKVGSFSGQSEVDLMLEHRSKISIAKVTEDSIGLKFEAKISPKLAHEIKNQNIKGASIGFTSIKENRNSRGEREITQAKLHEISLVSDPAHKSSHLEVRSKKNDLWKYELRVLECSIS